jgi:hypothetical protein
MSKAKKPGAGKARCGEIVVVKQVDASASWTSYRLAEAVSVDSADVVGTIRWVSTPNDSATYVGDLGPGYRILVISGVKQANAPRLFAAYATDCNCELVFTSQDAIKRAILAA